MSADVVVITRQRLQRRANGSSAYLLSLCAALHGAGFRLHLLCPTPATFGRWPAFALGREAAMFSSIRMRGAWRMGGWLIARDWRLAAGAALHRTGIAAWRSAPAAYAIALPISDADRGFVARHAVPGACVIADYAFLTPLIPAGTPGGGLVIMHDLFSSRAAQFTPDQPDSTAAISLEAETQLLALAGCVVAIQPEEAAFVTARLPGVPVVTAPMAVAATDQPQPGQRGVLFVGSAAAPNRHALAWLLAAVWPAVRAAVPGATLTIVGEAGRGVAAGAGLRVTGRVDDLGPFYRDAAVVVAPLREGSGLKIKLIEALAHGKAIVATSIALQGTDEAVRRAVVAADDPAGFAQAIIGLLQNPAARLRHGTAALAVARAQYSPAACYSGFIAAVSGMSLAPRQHDHH